MKQAQNVGGPVEIVFASIILFWAFMQVFVLCDFGENMMNKFGEVNDMIYSKNWYTFPQQIKRVIPIIMMGAQLDVILKGFANLTCTREAFKKVKLFEEF